MLKGDVEVYNAEKNQLRVELTGGGEVISFSFTGGQPESLTYAGREFKKVK